MLGFLPEVARQITDKRKEQTTLRDIGHGSDWWSARAGDHRVNSAWGHGGQLIVLVAELDHVVVTTADPFYLQHDGDSWRHERATINLVSASVASLLSE